MGGNKQSAVLLHKNRHVDVDNLAFKLYAEFFNTKKKKRRK